MAGVGRGGDLPAGAVLCRGDRKLGPVLLRAHELGCKMDGWAEHLKPELWEESFAENGIDPYFYTARRREYDEILPWDHMDFGVTKYFLIKESQKAHNAETTACCREKCAGCGANKLNGGVCDEIGKTVV